jgi:prepilin peptidase CpaA
MLHQLPETPLFVGSALKVGAGVILLALLCTAAGYDIRTRRIPNWLILVIAALGLVFSTATGGIPHGLVSGLLAVLVGLAIWLPGWIFRWLGAGDVKLFAATSAWLGVAGAIEGTLFAAFFGGLLALIWIVTHRGQVRLGGGRLPKGGRPPASAMPYTVALAAGAELAAWFPHLIIR